MAKQDDEAAADDAVPSPLWFAPPVGDRDRRRTLTRERVVAEALTVIGADGVDALSMRALATRLGVVPGALYRHVRNREQLHDLVLDEVLAQVDRDLDRALPWTKRVKLLAHRLGTVLQDRPGIAALLKTRDPLGPHSLALAEAFLATLQEAGLPKHETGLAFALVYDYTFKPCRPTASPRSSTSAKPSGSTTATNASRAASTPSSTGSRQHDAATGAAAPGERKRRR